MSYDYTFILKLPGVKKAKAMAFRAVREKSINRELPDEEKARQGNRFRAFFTLEDDISKIVNTVTKKYKYNPTYKGWKADPNDSSRNIEVSSDSIEEAEDWMEFSEISGPELNGREYASGTVYTDGLSDDMEAVTNGFERLSKPEAECRLTIFAHGNQESTSVGRRSPEEMIKLLGDLNLRPGAKRLRVSLVACWAGRIFKNQDNATENYAERLHKLIKEKLGIEVEVSARAAQMTSKAIKTGTYEFGKFVNMADDPESNTMAWKRKAPGSKFVWRWEDGKQVSTDHYAKV